MRAPAARHPLTLPPSVRASCGAAFCTLNAQWETQGVWTEPGMRVDLRFEYIDQDQPRAGRDEVAVGEIPRHHDEVRTINRNWIGTFDYGTTGRWGYSVQVPFIDRSHEHIHTIITARRSPRRGRSAASATCARSRATG